MHLRAQPEGDLSLVMLKEIFHDSFEIFEITRICMENHTSMTEWIQMLPTIGGRCNRTFGIYG